MSEARLANFEGLFAASPVPDKERGEWDVVTLHAAYGDFVWATLERLGVRSRDLDDQLQEVFVVVFRRLDSYDGSTPIRGWLYGVCRRVAAAYRRRGYVRHEVPSEVQEDQVEEGDGPFESASQREARGLLRVLLDELDLDKRVVFVMFEVEEISCEEIARALGLPLGTVYSRLHTARKDFQMALERYHKREARKAGQR